MSGFDYLDELAIHVAKGDASPVEVLSTAERLYVALAANSVELLEKNGYTVAEALARLDDEWTKELVERWRYRGNPKHFYREKGGTYPKFCV